MKTVVNEFLKQAALHPDNIAVLDIQGAVTYDRMNNLSACLAEKILEGSVCSYGYASLEEAEAETKKRAEAMGIQISYGCSRCEQRLPTED